MVYLNNLPSLRQDPDLPLASLSSHSYCVRDPVSTAPLPPQQIHLAPLSIEKAHDMQVSSLLLVMIPLLVARVVVIDLRWLF
jgi:hypothetical protein